MLKLLISKYFENAALRKKINIQHSDIHKTCEKVFCRINYRKKNGVDFILKI